MATTFQKQKWASLYLSFYENIKASSNIKKKIIFHQKFLLNTYLVGNAQSKWFVHQYFTVFTSIATTSTATATTTTSTMSTTTMITTAGIFHILTTIISFNKLRIKKIWQLMKHGAIRSFYNHAPSHSIDWVSISLKIEMVNEVRVKATKISLN